MATTTKTMAATTGSTKTPKGFRNVTAEDNVEQT
jgi:hypothetical protein